MRALRPVNPFLPLLLGAVGVLAGCTVKYRHEVEPPGTPANYTYGAGGFIRYDGYGEVAGDMEIASVDYRKPGSGVVVRLTGVIHIADLEYYRALQRECLDTADVVLFEGVKVEGQKKPEGGGDLGSLYSSVGKLLGVGFQKDGIDYQRSNFVHCDVTIGADDPLNSQIDPGQIQQAAQLLRPIVAFKTLLTSGPEGKRTDDALKHQMVSLMMMQMGALTDEEAIEHLNERTGKGTVPKPMQSQIERAAKALRNTPILPEFGMSKEMKEQILDRRNDYVVERLKERLEGEDHSREQVIAVFYGAAHGPGIAASLKEMGYSPSGSTWLRAWAMNNRGKEVVSERPPPRTTRPRPPARRRGEPTLY
ncbi:hypothetical protein ACFL59_00110 [Planctomycetota bacterium]